MDSIVPQVSPELSTDRHQNGDNTREIFYFTAEHIAEWASFGPPLKGRPTQEQHLAAQERKIKCATMKARLAREWNDPYWTEKKIEKELNRLVEKDSNNNQGSNKNSNNHSNNELKTPPKRIRRRVDGSPIIPVDISQPAKKIFLIRHGQSLGQAAKLNGMDRNSDRRLLDCALTQKGESEALGIPRRMTKEERESIQLVVSSPLTRALQTALLAFPSTNILVHYDLREIGCKVPENTPRPMNAVLKDLSNLLTGRPEDALVDIVSLQPRDWPRDYSPSVVKRDRIRKVFHHLYHERDEICFAVVCHYNVIRSAVVDSAGLAPVNAIPLACHLYSNGDVILC
jgi:broad specificity phosphatase PhoE